MDIINNILRAGSLIHLKTNNCFVFLTLPEVQDWQGFLFENQLIVSVVWGKMFFFFILFFSPWNKIAIWSSSPLYLQELKYPWHGEVHMIPTLISDNYICLSLDLSDSFNQMP